jgi:hypothetical protein
MKLKLWASVLLLPAVLLTSCGQRTQPATANRTEPMAVIILEYYHHGPRVVFLPNDYGFLVRSRQGHKPELYLYDKPARHITYTHDFNAFFAGLRKFPDRAKVDEIIMCSGESGMIGEVEETRLMDIIKKKRFRMTGQEDYNFPVCTCGSKEVRLLDDAW